MAGIGRTTNAQRFDEDPVFRDRCREAAADAARGVRHEDIAFRYGVSYKTVERMVALWKETQKEDRA